MPTPKDRLPRLCKHRDRAYVKLNGKQHQCGKWGTAKAQETYDRKIAEWLARGRKPEREAGEGPTVAEVGRAWLEAYTPTVSRARRGVAGTVVEDMAAMCGSLPAEAFGPKMLRALRATWGRRGLARSTINRYGAVCKQCFRWATAEEMVPAGVWHALGAVGGLRRGEGGVEREKVGPAPEEGLEAILGVLPAVAAAVARFQALTGMRPGEAVRVRGDEVDRSGPVWVWAPGKHKSAWRGRGRSVAIGPRAQAILAPWLERAGSGYAFPGRDGRGHYSPISYRKAVRRACLKAGVEPFSPNMLRHSLATEVRRRHGLEAAQVVLGHAHASISEIYSERDMTLAAKVAEEMG